MRRMIRESIEKGMERARGFRNRYFDDFCFVHINKTGGSSVERAFRLPLDHRTAVEKIADLGRDVWDRRFTFTVIRNPWDKVVSHYHFRVLTNQTNLGSHPIPFAEWVERTYGWQDPQYFDRPRMFLPQIDWISDAAGEVLVKFVMRFERLHDDFNGVCKMLGRHLQLPHERPSRRGPYRDYYDPQTRAIVARWFARDIDRFGYRF